MYDKFLNQFLINFERSDPIPAARVAQRLIFGRHYVTQNHSKNKHKNHSHKND